MSKFIWARDYGTSDDYANNENSRFTETIAAYSPLYHLFFEEVALPTCKLKSAKSWKTCYDKFLNSCLRVCKWFWK